MPNPEGSPPVRLAAIDIGTNSVLLTVAELDAESGLPKRAGALDRATITRLGKGVDRAGVLDPEAMERTLACLADYARLAGEAGAEIVDAVGTSAARDAKNGAEFLDRAERVLGIRPRILSGVEEAEATFAGALQGLAVVDAVVFDIGGGSTELVVGGKAPWRTSLDVGAVRMTERHVHSDPPSPSELEAVRTDVRGRLEALAPPSLEGTTLVGVAGTLTTLAAIELGLAAYDGAAVHGRRLSRATLERLATELAAERLEERKKREGLDPARADVIVAGAVIASEVTRWGEARGATGVIVSDGGVRWGLLAKAASSRS